MGHHRQQFLYESLQALNQQLDRHHQTLLIVTGDPVTEIDQLIRAYQVDVLGVADYPGFDERCQLSALRQQHLQLPVLTGHNNSLFTPGSLPFSVDDMPDKFSPFRHKVEKHATPAQPCAPVALLPPPPVALQTDWSALPLYHGNSTNYQGGEKAGQKQLKYYFFENHLISRYKETRNGLEGWDYSSKFSAWLANGALSARRIFAELKRYEAQHGANESTYWLYFELLWREFFWWLQIKHGHHWFLSGGIQRKQPDKSLIKDTLASWQSGTTDNDYINACMHQLNATGYMSNRARQWAASYLVNELGQDWRYGAAYFEQQLIDYDVGANWGNWQYLAGVGSDPRGLRHFNIEKQAQMYDPTGAFRNLWG
ncbi:cryptochrome DASH [Alteromonas lipolytica]|nr:cryptochrome DASH [Alteromonas lipolytica]